MHRNRAETTWKRWAFAGMTLGMLLTGCATPPTDPVERAEFDVVNDPLEPMNRYFFEVNRFLDMMFLRPWAEAWSRVVPEYMRQRVHNVLDNMGAPLKIVNEALQGRGEDTGTSAGRFVVNSTLGVAGVFDVATDWGLPNKNADFGQTLYCWGVGDGPYLVLPVMGPQNTRDAIGMGIGSAADPVGWAFTVEHLTWASRGKGLTEGIDKRAEFLAPMDALEKTSIDFYAQVRSMVRQYREKELREEEKGANPTYPDYDFYDDDQKTPTKK